VRDVQLLPQQAAARPATLNDMISEGSALRTGDDSRSELTFTDLTITRLGANTIFSFNQAGRSVRLDSGAILLYARKNSGPATITTKAVSVGITGTTVIVESKPLGYDRLLVLEGKARFSLNDYPGQTTEVRRGQLLNVNAGAKKLPKPGRVDLKRIVKTDPLIKDFPPLPSLDLILGRTASPAGGGSVSGQPVQVPNPSGPTGPGNVVPTPPPPPPNPTATPRHKRPPKPHPTPRPTPTRAPISSGSGGSYGGPTQPRPRPSATPRKFRPTPTPKPTIY
jgi:cell division septation protein DedD